MLEGGFLRVGGGLTGDAGNPGCMVDKNVNSF